MKLVEESVIPKIHQGILQGKNVRSISVGGRSNSRLKSSQSLNTSYPAYKEGVLGTKNRVIVLRIDDKDSPRPTYAVAALFDHDDDRAVNRSFYLKTNGS
jgi:hypothetical protein